MTQVLNDSASPSDCAAQYRREGFVVARHILPREQVDRIFSDMHRLAVQQLKRFGLPHGNGETPESVHQDFRRLFAQNLPTYLATLALCAKLASLHELYLHPRIRAFSREIGIEFPVFQTAPVMHLMSKSLRIPGGYQGFGVHQDWPALQGSLDTVTVWIPFVDIDEDLFTLDIIPRSHADGLKPYSRRDHIFEVDPDLYNEDDFESVVATRGDVVFMSSFAIHRTSLRGDDRLRVATSMRYENAAEPHFIARAYPFAHKRVVSTELITPNFPSPEQVGAIYRTAGKTS